MYNIYLCWMLKLKCENIIFLFIRWIAFSLNRLLFLFSFFEHFNRATIRGEWYWVDNWHHKTDRWWFGRCMRYQSTDNSNKSTDSTIHWNRISSQYWDAAPTTGKFQNQNSNTRFSYCVAEYLHECMEYRAFPCLECNDNEKSF